MFLIKLLFPGKLTFDEIKKKSHFISFSSFVFRKCEKFDYPFIEFLNLETYRCKCEVNIKIQKIRKTEQFNRNIMSDLEKNEIHKVKLREAYLEAGADWA